MNLTRSQLREKIMTILYQKSVYESQKMEYDIENIIAENMEIENEFVKELVYGITTHEDNIIKLANEYLTDWKIDRLDKAGQAILKIAIYELKYTETPQIVVINEAIELTKKYSDDNVRKMINAVLDRMINDG